MNARPMTIVSALTCVAILTACSGVGGQTAQGNETVASSGEVEAAAKNLQELYQRQNPAQAEDPQVETTRTVASTVRSRNATAEAVKAQPATPTPTNSDDLQVTLPSGEAKPSTPAGKGTPNAGGFRPSPAGRVTPTRVGAADWSSDRAAQMAKELSEMLAAQPATRSLFSRAVQLATLAEVAPSGDAALNDVRAKLTANQQAALNTVQSTVRSMVANADGDARALADLLRAAAQQIEQSDRQLNVPTMALCTKVEGYGRYTLIPSATLRAGRAQTVLVYTEVENFVGRDEGRDSSDNPRVRVEIGQSLELFTSSGTLIHQVPEQVAREVSARQRRDFYLLQRYEFPETLAPGTYTLKATVRDLMNGKSQAQVIMPITVTAGEVPSGESKPVQRGQ
jgi:hypothetical protein